MGSFCPNQINFQLKKCRRVISHGNDKWCKVSKKIDNFHSTPKCLKILLWWAFFCPNYITFELKKVQRNYLSWRWNVKKNYLSWHQRVIQTLKKNWLFVWKMTWGIWKILTRAVESLKTRILMSYFCRKYVMFDLKKYRGILSWNMTYGFKNDKEFGEILPKWLKVMLDKSSVYILAEGM